MNLSELSIRRPVMTTLLTASIIAASSRTAQCSTTKPSASRKMCTWGQATRLPLTGKPLRRGKPLPTWRP